jgi:hypothetical protein
MSRVEGRREEKVAMQRMKMWVEWRVSERRVDSSKSVEKQPRNRERKMWTPPKHHVEGDSGRAKRRSQPGKGGRGHVVLCFCFGL